MCEAMSFGPAERGLSKTRRSSAVVNSDNMALLLLFLCIYMPNLVDSRTLSSDANADFATLLQARVQSAEPKSVFITRHTADIGRYPYLVSLRREAPNSGDSAHFCGGTLISTDTVLTAAHCVDAEPSPVVHIGRYCSGQCSGALEHLNGDFIVARTVSVQRASAWDSDRFFGGNDIAVIKLDRQISGVEPIKMMGGIIPSDLVGDETLTVVGLGKDQTGSLAGLQQEGALPFKDNGRCQDMYDSSGLNLPNDFRIMDDMLCAGGGDTSACRGDSGGPLVRAGNTPDEDVLVAVVSFGVTCSSALADLNVPTIFIRVSEHADSLLAPFYPQPPPPPPPVVVDPFSKGPDHWISQPTENNGVVFVQAEGWDCRGPFFQSHTAFTVEECREMCAANDACEAFAFNAGKQVCRFKDSCDDWKPNDERIAGVKMIQRRNSDKPGLIVPVHGDEVHPEDEGPDISTGDSPPPSPSEQQPSSDEPVHEDPEYDFKDRIGCSGASINKFDAKDVHECEQRCNEEYGCAAFTFNWKKERCFLKAGCPHTRNHDNISGIRKQPKLPSVLNKIGCKDETLKSIRVSSFEDCEPECMKTTDCAVFTYDVRKRVCYLKASCFDQKIDDTDKTGFMKIFL